MDFSLNMAVRVRSRQARVFPPLLDSDTYLYHMRRMKVASAVRLRKLYLSAASDAGFFESLESHFDSHRMSYRIYQAPSSS